MNGIDKWFEKAEEGYLEVEKLMSNLENMLQELNLKDFNEKMNADSQMIQ